MQRTRLPGRIGETLVARLDRAILGLVRDDPADLAEETQPLADGDLRVTDGRLEDGLGGVDDVPGAKADQRIER